MHCPKCGCGLQIVHVHEKTQKGLNTGIPGVIIGKYYIVRNDNSHRLSKLQYRLMNCFADKHPDQYATMEDLIDYVYPNIDDEPENSRACVRQTIRKFNEKLRDLGMSITGRRDRRGGYDLLLDSKND